MNTGPVQDIKSMGENTQISESETIIAGVLVKLEDRRENDQEYVKKTYNKLGLEDCFIQCFLRRRLDKSEEHMLAWYWLTIQGAKPAGAIATMALLRSGDIYQVTYPNVSY